VILADVPNSLPAESMRRRSYFTCTKETSEFYVHTPVAREPANQGSERSGSLRGFHASVTKHSYFTNILNRMVGYSSFRSSRNQPIAFWYQQVLSCFAVANCWSFQQRRMSFETKYVPDINDSEHGGVLESEKLPGYADPRCSACAGLSH